MWLILLVGGLVALAGVVFWSSQATAEGESPPPESPDQESPVTGGGWVDTLFGNNIFGGSEVNSNPTSNDLIGSGLPEFERAIIIDAAKRFGIDPRLLAALRRTENGGPGREFGVLSVPAPTYQDQCTVAARTISNNLTRYETQTKQSPFGLDGRVTARFIEWFSAIYAPGGVANDPTNLNQYHAGNLKGFYAQINYA